MEAHTLEQFSSSAMPQAGFTVHEPETSARLALPLLFALQTTLDVAELMKIFAAQLQKVIPHQALSYRHTEYAIECDLGRRSHHSCGYQITLFEQDLGQLEISRSKRFSGRDLRRLERMLCALVYPLRNALQHARALAAAHRDALTGVGNRSALDAALHRELALAQRHEYPLSLLVIDLDWFKRINDEHGHAAGDSLLRAVADTLKRSVRKEDQVFRYGGEEFVVLLPATGLDGALSVAENLRVLVAQRLRIDPTLSVMITASFGVASVRAKESAASLFNRADRTLYQAKLSGRNQVQAAL